MQQALSKWQNVNLRCTGSARTPVFLAPCPGSNQERAGPITHTALPRYFGPDDEEHVGDVLCAGWGDFFFLSHAGAYGEGVPVK